MTGNLYAVSDLEPEELRLAFPVVRVLDPGLTLERWISYARAFLSPAARGTKSRILTVRNENGTIHGLAFCRLRPDLRYGRELEVDNFISLGFRGGKQAAGALLRGIEALATEWSCRHIRLSCFEAPEAVRPASARRRGTAVFRRAGYREEPRFLGKMVLAQV